MAVITIIAKAEAMRVEMAKKIESDRVAAEVRCTHRVVHIE